MSRPINLGNLAFDRRIDLPHAEGRPLTEALV